MRALVAFDKFKGSLSAPAACAVAAEALQSVRPEWHLDVCPLADGGEGFVEILNKAAGGTIREFVVANARGKPVQAAIGFVRSGSIPASARRRLNLPRGVEADDTIAVIEMAASSGLAQLASGERDPWETTSGGTGELIAAAGELGCAAILLGIGGSATNDLGLGALAALGFEFVSASGKLVRSPAPRTWSQIERIGGAVAANLPPIRIACDVDNPLLGPRGCTAVFGPQKGLAARDIEAMERAAARMAAMLCTHARAAAWAVDEPGAGAAGGLAFGLRVAAGAELIPGFELVADWLDLDRRIAAADVVMTGEGRFDQTSLDGKAPGALLERATKSDRTVHIFAGRIECGSGGAAQLHEITPPGMPIEEAQTATADLLRDAVRRQFSTSMSEGDHHQEKARHFARRRRAKWLLRLVPRRARMHKYPVVGRFAQFARRRAYLWSFKSEHMRPAFYAGSILSLLPVMGVQLPLALLLSLLLRANFMVLGGLQFVTNPFTAAPIYYATHQLGARIIHASGFGQSIETVEELEPKLHEAEITPQIEPARVDPQPGAIHWTRRIGTAINALVIGGVVAGGLMGAGLDLLWKLFGEVHHRHHRPRRPRPPPGDSPSTGEPAPPQ